MPVGVDLPFQDNPPEQAPIPWQRCSKSGYAIARWSSRAARQLSSKSPRHSHPAVGGGVAGDGDVSSEQRPPGRIARSPRPRVIPGRVGQAKVTWRRPPTPKRTPPGPSGTCAAGLTRGDGMQGRPPDIWHLRASAPGQLPCRLVMMSGQPFARQHRARMGGDREVILTRWQSGVSCPRYDEPPRGIHFHRGERCHPLSLFS